MLAIHDSGIENSNNPITCIWITGSAAGVVILLKDVMRISQLNVVVAS